MWQSIKQWTYEKWLTVKRWGREVLIGTGIVGVAIAATLSGGEPQGASVQSPYIDAGEFRELPVQAQVENAGGQKVRIAKDRPEAVFEKWNGEVAMKVSVPGVKGSANRTSMSSKLTYGDGNTQVQMRQAENGYKIDFVLNNKPQTNEFTMQIDNAENLDFFYQPELTQEEIDNGAHRPENVVGSYAVYHKTKKNHIVGETNYATGKAYHIYRPKVIDDAGSEVWGEMSYQNGELTVTVPQSFLDKAVYPVVVDPIFGYDTAGGSQEGAVSDITGSFFTISEDGDVSKLTAYLDAHLGDDNLNSDAGIYSKTGTGKGSYSYDTPDNSQVIGDEVTHSSDQTGFWQDYSFNSGQEPALSGNTDYWLLFGGPFINSFNDSSYSIYYDSGSTDQGVKDIAESSGNWPSSFDNSGTPDLENRKYSIYATYTVTAPAEETTNSQIW